MADLAETGPKDIVLEIGPGRGILTEELLKTGARVVAVEKDPKLFDFLNKKFETFVLSSRLTLVRADIRDFFRGKNDKSRALTISDKSTALVTLTVDKVVANIPYYLTGQILRLLLSETKFGIKMVVLMLQKEVAKRIVADQSRVLTISDKSTALVEKKEKKSVLSISVQAYADPKIAFLVKKGNFWPQPKVDSAVVVFKRREKDFFRQHKISQEGFFDIVKAGFSHPRKLLKNNLKGLLDIGCRVKCGVKENARAEDLSLENWACLAKNIPKL